MENILILFLFLLSYSLCPSLPGTLCLSCGVLGTIRQEFPYWLPASQGLANVYYQTKDNPTHKSLFCLSGIVLKLYRKKRHIQCLWVRLIAVQEHSLLKKFYMEVHVNRVGSLDKTKPRRQ